MSHSKIYLFHHGQCNGKNCDEKIKDLINVNPDTILLFCFEEADAHIVFRNLLPKLSEWLVKNNKIAKILISNPDNHEVAPNIFTEKTFGYQFCISGCLNAADELNIDFTKSHLFASKLYTCYNDAPKYHRAITIDLLAKENLIDYGIVTVHQPEKIFTDYSGARYEYKYYDKQIRKDEDEYDRYDIKFNSGNMARSFLKGFVDIVTETQYSPHQKFLTEKTTKSIGALKPFLAVSSVNFHKYLEEEYGIEPYPELFDYSFDSMSNIFDRATGVVENLKKIMPIFNDVNEKNKIHDLLLPRMIENKKRLINYTFNREKMIPPSLEFVTKTKSYELFGDVKECEQVFNFYKKMNWMK